MSFIEVSATELRNKASELQGLNSKFQSETENLLSHLTNLNTMWEGEAKEAFNNAFMRDKGNMDNFKTAIDQYVQALMLIAERYEEAEKRNLSMVGSSSY